MHSPHITLLFPRLTSVEPQAPSRVRAQNLYIYFQCRRTQNTRHMILVFLSMGQCTLHVSMSLPPPRRPNLLECVPVDYCLRIDSQRIRCRVDIDQQTFFSASMIFIQDLVFLPAGLTQSGYSADSDAAENRAPGPKGFGMVVVV